MSVKVIGRNAGRSATAAAAYRCAVRIVDVRTGEVHDYTRKMGVLATALMLPGGATLDRAAFWNGVEQHHKRGDAVLAREFTLALPAELPDAERARLAFDYGRELADRYGVAVDVAIHEPDKQGDQRNHHAHVLMSACTVAPDGSLGRKAVELDPIHCQKHRIENFAERERMRWAGLHNERMASLGRDERIDHRSLEAQGIDRPPTRHMGPAVAEMERRGIRTNVGWRIRHDANEQLVNAAQLGEIEREAFEVSCAIIDTEINLQTALQERARRTAEMTVGRAAIEAESARRVTGLDRLPKNGGVSNVFATNAQEALLAAGSDPSKVDWGAVEVATARECLNAGHDAEAVIDMLVRYSPLRADPASHSVVTEVILGYAARLEAQHEQAKQKHNGPRGPGHGT
ncbi:MobA/MobL family protein [Burkholderia lata]|uniref:MobA/MobL family protein n=1 Tax=Burkholderia lata (strain ATCC 17760 / DSM 23089 / LMG 22485 / NCIMB 9086 / R18194 / 383) TaxID=482957 RepID=UPI0015824BBF|nr:MobA/MobL family protein [Burkholderia lata]